jgi:FAD/FMN-containing dehydrogenase
VASDATAFAPRGNPHHFEILGFWDRADEDEANLEWVTDFFAAMRSFDAGEVYVNSLDEGEGHRVREAYGSNYDRLVTLKSKYDPTNIFRCNHNIPPS